MYAESEKHIKRADNEYLKNWEISFLKNFRFYLSVKNAWQLIGDAFNELLYFNKNNIIKSSLKKTGQLNVLFAEFGWEMTKF